MNKETLYSIRKELGWTMQRTGQQTGYSAGFINNMEKGRELLSLAFIQAFKKAIIKHLNDSAEKAKIIRRMIK